MENLKYKSLLEEMRKTIGDYTCDFCFLNFCTRAERNDHVMGHFKKKSCADCSKILIRIADEWYEIHTDSNCDKLKCKSELNANTKEDCGEVIIKIECPDYPAATNVINNSNEGIMEFSEFIASIDGLSVLNINMNAECNEKIPIEKKPVGGDEPLICKKQSERKKLKIIGPQARNYTKPPQVKCNICNAVMSKIKIKTHLQRSHVPRIVVKKQPFMNVLDPWNHRPKSALKCDICQKTLRNFTTMSSHMNNLHIPSEKPERVRCDECGQLCYDLKSHQKVHSAFGYVCTYCGKGFNRLNNLTEHTNQHTGEKPHKCHWCDKAFSRKPNLVAHTRIHTGERPYKCPIEGCVRAYSYSSDLKRHKYGVHGIYTNKHICTICSKVYSERKLLRKHLESH